MCHRNDFSEEDRLVSPSIVDLAKGRRDRSDGIFVVAPGDDVISVL